MSETRAGSPVVPPKAACGEAASKKSRRRGRHPDTVGGGTLSPRIGFARRRRAVRARLVLPFPVFSLWWLYWYTDEIAVRREGVENFVPVSSLPPTFFWLTVVLGVWCLLGAARWLTSFRAERAAAVV